MTTVAPIPSAIPAPPSSVLEASGSGLATASQAQSGETNSKDPGLPLTRPRIVIPSQVLTLATSASSRSTSSSQQDSSLLSTLEDKPAVPMVTPKVTPPTATTTTTRTVESGKEKVGRWSEEEHKVFLEGLGKHGKQWKLIAGMIGTRTVVQVRTHAQKYFQRVERHNQKQAGGGTTSTSTSSSGQGGAGGTSHVAKRKMSLPASLPSRSKKVKVSGKKASIPRSASISMVSTSTLRTKSPPPELMSTHPSYISNDSASSSDCSWTYTVSPAGVNEMYEQLETLQCLTQDIQQQDTLVVQQEQAPVEAQPEVQMYDFNGLGQDPLEWLIDAEPSILPESSLPVFPDLSSSVVSTEEQATQVAAAAAAAAVVTTAVPETDDLEPNPVEVPPAVSRASDDSLEPSIVNELNTIADPTMTVQSLFLLPTNDC